MMNEGRRNSFARRPFWLPAIPFYSVSAIVAAGFFLSTIAVLGEGRDGAFVTAAIVATGVLVIAVLLREIIVRNFQINAIEKQKMLERSVLSAAISKDFSSRAEKLGLDEHAKMLAELKRKSEAAKVLSPIAESHREVFELCERYIGIVSDELPRVGVGSPRLSPLTKGRRRAELLHKFHMLQWAEIEVRTQTRNLAGDDTPDAREERIGRATEVIGRALSSYPDEPDLIASRDVLIELLANIRAAGLVKVGRKFVDEGNPAAAEDAFSDAADLLSSEKFVSDETRRMRDVLDNEMRSVEQSRSES